MDPLRRQLTDPNLLGLSKITNLACKSYMKRVAFAAFVVLAAWASPAFATPELKSLFTAIQATGTTIVVDGPECKDKQLSGRYAFRRNVIDQLTICVSNHNGDNAELYDTILHESVHVAQACKGGNLFTNGSIFKAATDEELKVVRQHYDQSQSLEELEARVIAREQDEVFVTNLIKEHCK